MTPELAPQFMSVCDRLRRVGWCSNVGLVATFNLPYPHRSVGSAAAARSAIEQPDWEDLTLQRRNELTSFLHQRFRHEYSDRWNKIVDEAAHFLDTEIDAQLLPALSGALPGSHAAVASVRWDLLSALMEAAYADYRPPSFFTHLLVVYEAGHLPVGWDGGSESGVLLIY